MKKIKNTLIPRYHYPEHCILLKCAKTHTHTQRIKVLQTPLYSLIVN